MRLVVRVVDETAKVHPVAAGQVLEDAERPDFIAFVGRKWNAVAQEKQRARLGQRGTNVNKGRA
ncbi:MAG: hypothetical protein AB7H70_12415 [Rhodospirillaceae bacterium]